MGRAVKRERASASSGNTVNTERELRAVKREKLSRNRAESCRDESTQPEEVVDRRVLRSKYLALYNKISDERNDLTRVGSEKFASIIKEVEDLHQHVQKPREQVADAEALLGIASSLVSSVKSMSNEGITVADFVSCLLTEFGQANRTLENEGNAPNSVKWKEIGLAVSPIFLKCVGFRTMVGPMNAELKQRRTVLNRGVRRRRPTEKSQPEEVNDSGAEEKTDTDNNMATMFEILRRKKRARLENLILNRRSFSRTVENLFALSFLVKDGRVEIIVDESGSHIVSPRNAPAADSVTSGEVTFRHFVFRFDFKDWKVMMNSVPDGDELMPDRKSSPSELDPAANSSLGNLNRTPIRKLSRNRGLVVQEDSVVEDSPGIEGTNAIVSLRCKRKLI